VPAQLQARFHRAHTLFVNKWYFDEAIDLVIVRPVAWLGRFCATTFERVVVQGALVGGTSGLVGLASAAVRRVQTGYLRYYAALLLMGLTGLGAYFLISA
jgi:NADH-quinone oxidoreductase subunit L